jgi:hypothetical protein
MTDTSCINCKFHNKREWVACKAFPDGIPFAILSGEITHFTPIDGDHGTQFKPIEEDMNGDLQNSDAD